MQGSTDILSSIEHVSVSASLEGTVRLGVFRRVLDCMDWGSGGNSTDQIAWWKHVSALDVELLYLWLTL